MAKNKKKKQGLHNFIESINKKTGMSYVWKKIRILRNSGQHVQWNKWQTKDRSVAIEEAIDKVSPPWVTNVKIKKATSVENNKYNAEVTQEKIVRAIKGVRKESSPGLDGIKYSMFKWIPQECIISLITKLFNVFWTEGRLPISWKEYQVLFIDKQDKKSVRPIALSSCLGNYTKE